VTKPQTTKLKLNIGELTLEKAKEVIRSGMDQNNELRHALRCIETNSKGAPIGSTLYEIHMYAYNTLRNDT